MACFRCIIVNTLHKGENYYDIDNNNNNNNRFNTEANDISTVNSNNRRVATLWGHNLSQEYKYKYPA